MSNEVDYKEAAYHNRTINLNGTTYEYRQVPGEPAYSCEGCIIVDRVGCPCATLCSRCASEDGLCMQWRPAEVQEMVPATGALKFDTGKTDLTLLPMWAIEDRVNLLPEAGTPCPASAELIREAVICLAKFAQGDMDTRLLKAAIDSIVDSFSGGWPEAMHELSKVRAMGAAKYARNDWRTGFKDSRLIAASLRHAIGGWDPSSGFIPGYLSGETTDRESGFDHRGHMLFGPIVVLDQMERGVGERDMAD